MQKNSVAYTFIFATVVCLFFSVIVSSAAVSLKEQQEANAVLDRQKKVLAVTGLMPAGESWTADKIESTFNDKIKAKVIDLKTGEYVDGVDAAAYDQQKASRDPERSIEAPDNRAKVGRIPHHALVYHLVADGNVDMLVLPVEGKGLWSTLYGYLALDKDVNTVRGLTLYQHAETPGLGGEVDNPKWKSLWPNRKVYDENGKVKIAVIKGTAGSPEEDPYNVDGLSGATITANGVSYLLQFWLSQDAFGPYLSKFKQQGA